jgi:hypothetical protein
MIKPGYKTSEFWFTLVSFLFSGLYLLGLLDSNSQKEDLISETSRGLEALILIVGQLTVLFRYIKGRTEIKKIWRTNQPETKPSVEPTPKPAIIKTRKKRSKKNDTKRNSSKRI